LARQRILRAVGEQAVAALKSRRLPRTLCCGTTDITDVVKPDPPCNSPHQHEFGNRRVAVFAGPRSLEFDQ
jgi:hypothetical protein